LAYVPSLEAQLKTFNGTIVDLNIELHARELSVEWTITAKDDFQHQSTQLTKKLQGTWSSHCRLSLASVFH
jgi:phage-related protein